MRHYKIKKGQHRDPFHLPRIVLGRTGCARFRVRFDDGCLVSPEGVDRYDFSKGPGMAVGDHHIESIRLGWRSTGKEIELAAYYYVDGVRYSDKVGEMILGSIKPGEWVEVFMSIRPGCMFITALGRFIRVDRGEENSPWPIVYMLNPFYGGDQPAQADCEIDVEVVEFTKRLQVR